jgi:hypothetical protein
MASNGYTTQKCLSALCVEANNLNVRLPISTSYNSLQLQLNMGQKEEFEKLPMFCWTIERQLLLLGLQYVIL